MTNTHPIPHPLPHPPGDPAVLADLRTDHAGETGAVWIYKGILAVTRNDALRSFAAAHLATEQTHLDIMTALVPAHARTMMIGPWKLAGWLTGALPAAFGPKAVYATIDAVESFVDHHYQEQIDILADRPDYTDLRNVLIACQIDEIDHRNEARAASGGSHGLLLSTWMTLVRIGSAGAVAISRRL